MLQYGLSTPRHWHRTGSYGSSGMPSMSCNQVAVSTQRRIEITPGEGGGRLLVISFIRGGPPLGAVRTLFRVGRGVGRGVGCLMSFKATQPEILVQISPWLSVK